MIRDIDVPMRTPHFKDINCKTLIKKTTLDPCSHVIELELLGANTGPGEPLQLSLAALVQF